MLVVICLWGGGPLTSYLQGCIDVESDCEGDSTGAGDGALEPEQEMEEDPRAVLTTGSFSAYVHFPSCLRLLRNIDPSSWKSLFFYFCTGVISFAPLKSQGVDARSDYIRRKKGAAVPPPCSPKSIHVLACLVRKPPIKRLTCETDAVNQARDRAPSRHRTCRYQE